MAARGEIAALLVKGAKAPEASGRVRSAQAVLDAVKAGDAEALDAALGEWCEDYEGGEDEHEEG